MSVVIKPSGFRAVRDLLMQAQSQVGRIKAIHGGQFSYLVNGTRTRTPLPEGPASEALISALIAIEGLHLAETAEKLRAYGVEIETDTASILAEETPPTKKRKSKPIAIDDEDYWED